MSHDEPVPPPQVPPPSWQPQGPVPGPQAAPPPSPPPAPKPETYLDGTPVPPTTSFRASPPPVSPLYSTPVPPTFPTPPAPWGTVPSPHTGVPPAPASYPYATRPTGTDGFAITALVLGLLGGWLGIVFGAIALRRIKRDGTQGRGMALAGIWLGAIWTAVVVVGIVAAVAIPAYLHQRELTQGQAPDASTGAQAPGQGADGDASTELLALLPLEVAGLSTTGWTVEPTLLQQEAIEGYTARFTDGTAQVDATVAYWSTAEEADAWATTYVSMWPDDALVDSGDVTVADEVVGTYWVYGSPGAPSVIVWTDATTSTALVGPLEQADALFQGFPI